MDKLNLQRLILAACCGCLAGVLGCESPKTAIEARSLEFQYSGESLAEETIDRLKRVRPISARVAASNAARLKKSRSLDPGSDEEDDRIDPDSMEGIVADCAVKIRHIESLGSDADIQAKVLAQVAATTAIPTNVREEFLDMLKQELTQNR
ncbi:hypothetical protein [Blastopirellula marina]|uniref:Lipoprotein n=1 Tax=Blastopirellula marina DSM 3645 TaxID=314230 RepID=A3ZSV6_9BACT|nr:hypothetical protein [Blastopirellula marina]EAQ80381.1 hypothetical protein DSM3645_11067 [Blastopirellula marina DSM 3645]